MSNILKQNSELEIPIEKQQELGRMQSRIRKIVADPIEKEKARKDFLYTFGQLGLNDKAASDLCDKLFVLLGSHLDLLTIEAAALKLLENTKIGESENAPSIIDILDEKLAGRAELIFTQIAPFAKGLNGRVVDYGTGDGQVAQLLQDRLGLEISGTEVRDYRKPGVTIPITILENDKMEVADGTFEAAILTNVLHHELNNENILQELKRVVRKGGRLIILETVPVGQTEAEMEADKDRTFANDYLYNRMFHNADVPVPGAFETVEGWKKRFAAEGWKIIAEEDLGFDQKTIKDRHYLYILEA